MSEISCGEVSETSGEVYDAENGVRKGETEKPERPETEAVGRDVDKDFSDELDDYYSSYISSGRIGDYTKEETDEAEEPEAPDTGEPRLEKDASDSEGEGLDNEKSETKETAFSDGDREKLMEETGWSKDVVDKIENERQAEIYKNAELHEETIDGRVCLVKDIDYDYVDEKTGMTNRELMAKGRSPIDAKTGEKIELHHMGQEYDVPFAELAENSEHGDGNHSVLHPKTEDSWRHSKDLASQYQKEKREHWKTRSEGES